MDTSKIYRLLWICMVIQGYLCYPCNNGNCYSCPSSCVICESNGYCKECMQGFYGETCTETCHSYCRNNTCGKFSGLCETCENGYFLNTSNLCIQCPTNCLECISKIQCSKCRTGFLGDMCHEKCVNCKPGTACEKSTGFCLECKDGLSGESCNTKCSPKCQSCERRKQDKCICCSYGRYGTNCEYECSETCSTTCNITDGSCLHGCSSGFWGMMCNNSCATNCLTGSCNRLDGFCTYEEKYPWYGFLYITIPLVVLAVLAVLTVVICLKRRGACRKGEPTTQPTTDNYEMMHYSILGVGSDKLQGAGEGLCAYYIDGTERKRAYILCKDPKSSEEVSEFWEMVLIERCNMIVMLTGMDELPNVAYCSENPEQYGSIRVTTVGILYNDVGDIKELTVEQNDEVKSVVQVQWRSNLSRNVENLIPFWELVKRKASDKHSSGPVIIRSSNGVIRCGPYLALDIYLEKRQSGQTTQISECCEFLRKQNPLLLTDGEARHAQILIEKMKDNKKDTNEKMSLLPS